MSRRVLLKLSGEALEGDGQGLSVDVLAAIAHEVRTSVQAGSQVGIVLGGGNLFRGLQGAAAGMNRSTADAMGMLATVINCLGFADALRKVGQAAVVFSAVPVGTFCRPFARAEAIELLEQGTVVLLAGGTGNPYFTTDTAAALRALEIGAQRLLKATKVDGIYDRDPVGDAGAKRFDEISYKEVLRRELRVMDLTAVTLCRENKLPLLVFDVTQEGNVSRAIAGEPIGTEVVPP